MPELNWFLISVLGKFCCSLCDWYRKNRPFLEKNWVRSYFKIRFILSRNPKIFIAINTFIRLCCKLFSSVSFTHKHESCCHDALILPVIIIVNHCGLCMTMYHGEICSPSFIICTEAKIYFSLKHLGAWREGLGFGLPLSSQDCTPSSLLPLCAFFVISKNITLGARPFRYSM